MKDHNIDAYIVPSEDAHMSEYVAACDERRAFLTGFTGSAGIALITHDAAYVWTDGRYFVQASLELDSSVFNMMRWYEDPPLEEWAASNLPNLSVVAVDARTVSVSSVKRIRAAFASAAPRVISLLPMPPSAPNLVDAIWASARPACPAAPIRVHDVRFAGVNAFDKLREVRDRMVERSATVLIVTGLDEVAWLLNMRGSDVDFNPVFWAYIIVTLTTATIYVNHMRFEPDVVQHLNSSSVEIRPYDAIYSDLANMNLDENANVWLDPSACNYAILDAIEKAAPSVRLTRKQGPIPLAKARKNETELAGVRNCHVRDGVAMCKFMSWLDRDVGEQRHAIDECQAAEKLDGLRAEQDLFVSLSFPTISSSDANGAIIHYRPEKKTCAQVSPDGMYLVDSGGQYFDGTTDVTRTVHLGEPTPWQKECFTRVLQGHIAIDQAVFPKGTTGHLLDGFARRPLWVAGLDYKHGTGHGVGAFLNVHEGPHMITFKPQALDTALDVGFLTSNEPGYYEEGNFGIRIENVCIVQEASVKGPPSGSERPYFRMEHVTLVPIQTKLIDETLLSEAERLWVNNYHRECWEKLAPLLQEDAETLAWLKRNTQKLPTCPSM